MEMDFREWGPEIQRMLPFYGQSMAQSATGFFEKGQIDRRTYINLSNSSGSGGDS